MHFDLETVVLIGIMSSSQTYLAVHRVVIGKSCEGATQLPLAAATIMIAGATNTAAKSSSSRSLLNSC